MSERDHSSSIIRWRDLVLGPLMFIAGGVRSLVVVAWRKLTGRYYPS